jgi:hypothetical protein
MKPVHDVVGGCLPPVWAGGGWMSKGFNEQLKSIASFFIALRILASKLVMKCLRGMERFIPLEEAKIEAFGWPWCGTCLCSKI